MPLLSSSSVVVPGVPHAIHVVTDIAIETILCSARIYKSEPVVLICVFWRTCIDVVILSVQPVHKPLPDPLLDMWARVAVRLDKTH